MKPDPWSRAVQKWACLALILSFALSGCNLTSVAPPTVTLTPTIPVAQTLAPSVGEPTPAAQDGTVAITFRVSLPESLSAGDVIFLVVVDELTGLPYNQQHYRMAAENDHTLAYTLRVPAGSTVHYRYLRLSDQSYISESLRTGEIQFRTSWAGVDTTINDRVFCWTGTPCNGEVGRIAGVVTNEAGQSLPGIWISAGGVHAISSSDGSYLLEDVPAGFQNLTAFAANGLTYVFQQGAQVNPGALTPANFSMQTLPLVEVVFTASLPVETPADAVVRIAGNITQLGNVFATLDGNLRIAVPKMPVMNRLENGRYFYRTMLPAGTEIRYRYTLGDGLWNSEHTTGGPFVERRVIVPDHNLIIEDSVATWRYGQMASVDLFVHIPTITPSNELISVQFDPGLGWMEPLVMWPVGENLWHLILYSPLVGIPQIKYRYCRNLQCDSSPEVLETPRVLIPGDKPQVIEDTVSGWESWHGASEPAIVPSVDLPPRTPGFIAGIGWSSLGFRTTWTRGFASAVAETAGLNASWMLLRPTWSVDDGGAALIAFDPAENLDGEALNLAISEAQARQLNLMFYPDISVPGSYRTNPLSWWQAASRDFSWWLSWFESYKRYLLNFATLAEQKGVKTLILGGDWIAPAFSWGLLPDGSISGSPGDSDERWRNLLAEVRVRFHGNVYWAVPYDGVAVEPPIFTDLVDGLFVQWSEGLSPFPSYDSNSMAAVAGALLDVHIRELRVETGKPIILGLSYPSARGSSSGCVNLGDQCAGAEALMPGTVHPELIVLDLQEQEAVYNAMFTAIADREWIDGVIVMDFYPAGPVQDYSASVYAKPASGVVWYWFGKFLGR